LVRDQGARLQPPRRHLYATPLVLSGKEPMVSFTFDDIPDTAADIAAPMIEEYGGRATF
jgi:peptidoglycan/xylan/chitin deacetylase (PgdA/CDA1 family)